MRMGPLFARKKCLKLNKFVQIAKLGKKSTQILSNFHIAQQNKSQLCLYLLIGITLKY